jgi:hypothetical protein
VIDPDIYFFLGDEGGGVLLGGLLPLPGPDGFPVVLGKLGVGLLGML